VEFGNVLHLSELPRPHRRRAEVADLFALTTSCSASIVSSMGVAGSKRCIWPRAGSPKLMQPGMIGDIWSPDAPRLITSEEVVTGLPFLGLREVRSGAGLRP
jgi:hypothetical protein